MALLTRSRLSRTLASGKPTMLKSGSPVLTSTSTWTGCASTPNTAAVRKLASTSTDDCKSRRHAVPEGLAGRSLACQVVRVMQVSRTAYG